MRNRLPHPLTLASAVLYVLSFPPYDLSFLGWIALVPWLLALSSIDSQDWLKRALIQGLWLGSIVGTLGFFWVAYVLRQFGGLPWPIAGLGLILFSFISQPQWLVFAPLSRLIFRKNPRLQSSGAKTLMALLWLALTYAVLDWLAPKIFRDTFGHHWSNFESLRMNARWAGAYGLTFMASFSNLAIAYAIYAFKIKSTKSFWPSLKLIAPTLLTAMTLLGSAWAYGKYTSHWVINKIESTSDRARLAVIQANIGDVEKFAAKRGAHRARYRIMNTFLEMSDQALKESSERPMAVVWPETAFPSSFRKPRYADEAELDQMVENYAKTRQIPIFFGGYDEDSSFPPKDYNAFFFLGKDASTTDLQVYHKTRLLLFGEELPFSELFPQLRRWFPQVGNFGRGRGPEPFSLPTQPAIKAVPAICYEVLFSEDMARAKRLGAQLILNITNDSWFGPFAEPQLHLALSTFRSIETGIPMLRATNTGISAVVDPAGRVLQKTDIGAQTILDARIPIVTLPPSPVEKWGDFFPKVALGLCIGALFFPSFRKNLLS